MLNLLPAEKGICLQGEDEIASIGFCIGASMGGLKAMTATSGPGISLFSEQISFAVGSEVPLVIVDVQRLGPSTGSATKGADGDIQFLRWGNSGGLPIIVLAPSDVGDCFTLTIHAFNLAEKYRCPVFIASNKEIGMTRESIDLDQIDLPEPIKRTYCSDPESFKPYLADSGTNVPQFLPMGGDIVVRQTSSTHGADGYITVSTEHIAAAIKRMEKKIVSEVEQFHLLRIRQGGRRRNSDHHHTASPAGPPGMRSDDSAKTMRKYRCLFVKTLYPVPEKLLQSAISEARKVLVVEMNLGQYVREIERLSPPEQIAFYGRMDGELISPEEIMGAVC